MRRPTSYSFVVALVAGLSSQAQAQLGNVAYTEDELFKPLSYFDEGNLPDGPSGSNTVVMYKGLLIVAGTLDSGVPPGTLSFFDVSDPKNPVNVHSVTGAPVAGLRELHAMPIGRVGGKDYLVLPTIAGIQIWDITDPMQAAPAGELDLDGVNGGDYDNAAWLLSWSPPYIFVGGLNHGVFIINASDPTQPELVNRIATGETGGYKVGPNYPAGNYLVVSGTDDSASVSVIDVSDVNSPFMVATGASDGDPYSTLVIGDRVYMPGEGGDLGVMSWNENEVVQVGKGKFGGAKGGYCTYQDAFLFCGQSEAGLVKIDVSDDKNLIAMGRGTGNRPNHDEDFATVIGNLVFLGNDNGTGSALMPHSMSPDTNPPTVVKIYPEEGELMAPLTSRVTVYFSDNIDITTVSSETLVVQPGTPGAAPVEGSYALSSFNAISFGPSAPLVAGETYEVVVRANGLKDIAGNAVPETVISRFSTGDALKPPRTDVPVDPPEMMPTGGAGGGTMVPTTPPTSGGTTAVGGSAAMPPGTEPTVPSTMDPGIEAPVAGTGGAAATPAEQSESGGCAVASAPSGAGWWLLPALGLAGLVRRRRSSGHCHLR